MKVARTRTSFRDKVAANSTQQRNKTANYGHLMVPRGVPIFKEEGDSRVNLDILPYVVTDPEHPDRNSDTDTATKDSLWYRRPYRLHRNIGADNVAIVCPTSVGKKCPICEYRKKMLDEGANWQDEAVKALRAGNRNLYYVQPKDEKKLEDKPHLWDISQFCFQDKLNNELEENDEYASFPDLEDGLTLRIRFSEETIGKQKFAETSRIDFEQRNYVYDEKEIEALPSLDDVLIIKDYRDIEALFFETGEADDETQAAQRTAKTTGTARARSEATDDDAPRTTARAGNTKKAPETEQRERVRRRTPEPEPEPEAAPEETARPNGDDREARRAARASRETKKNDDCPHGYTFGADCDKHTECENCAVWGKCMDALEAAGA